MQESLEEQSTAEGHAATVAAVLSRHGLGLRGAPIAVADSVRNHNYRAETDDGARFVRIHKEGQTAERLETIHRAMAWARDAGLPVYPPERDLGGDWVCEIDGLWVAVYPWIEGRTLVRGEITVDEAAVLGAIHGRLQAALAAYMDATLRSGGGDTNWDTGRAIAALSRVDDVIRYYPAPGEERLQAQSWLRVQLELLETEGLARLPGEFGDLPSQPCHGDFHERNVLLDDDASVAAVVDWERVSVFPRGWELVRALDYVCGLDERRVAAYVEAFRESQRFESGESARAVELWWQVALHDTWAFTMVFIRGDERPARFLPEAAPRLRLLSDPANRARLAALIAGRLER